MKWLNLLAIVPIVIGVLIFKNAVSGRKPPEKSELPEVAVSVETERVEKMALPRLLTGFGTVVSDREWTAVPQISGKVTYVHPNLKTGDYIAEGQVLFVVETVDQELEQERILAERRALQAEIRQVDSQRSRLEESLRVARESLKLLEKEYDRYQTLYQKGATPASTVDARRRDVLNQERAIKDIQTSLSSLPDQQEAVRARIDANRANLQKQSVQIDRSVVKAPFTGRVGEVYLEKDQVVSAGSQLFTMQGAKEARVEARFPQAQLANFPVREAYITTPEGKQLQARIGPLRERIDPTSRTGSVQLIVPTPPQSVLLPGALVEVVLKGDSHEPMPVVSRSVIRNGQVFLVENGRLARRDITQAFREGDLVAVKEGLKAGDEVVTSDPGLAMDGSEVRVVGKEQ